MRIDAHQHYWRLARGDYAWLTPALRPIHRDYGVADLAPLLDAARMQATVLVQAAPTDNETDYLLQVAAQPRSRVMAVVGWSSMEGAKGAARLATLAAKPLLRGVRPMLHDIADPDWILAPGRADTIAVILERDLGFDALVRPVHLPAMLRLAERHPRLRIVIDHGAKPRIAAGEFASWARAIRTVAQHTSACCKLSGLVTEAGGAWRPSALAPYIAHLLDVFGPARLMWGSDWPVVNLASSYGEWCGVAEAALRGLTAREHSAVMGANAAVFYGPPFKA